MYRRQPKSEPSLDIKFSYLKGFFLVKYQVIMIEHWPDVDLPAIKSKVNVFVVS